MPKAGVALVTEAFRGLGLSIAQPFEPLLFLPFPFLPLLSCLSSVRTPALACFTVTAANRAYVYRNSGRGKGGIKLKPRRLSHVARVEGSPGVGERVWDIRQDIDHCHDSHTDTTQYKTLEYMYHAA